MATHVSLPYANGTYSIASHTHGISLPPVGYSQYDHTHNFNPYNYTNYPNDGTPHKEPEMSTLEKIKQQRKEERERGRIERMYAEYDESGLSGYEDGTVVTFEWEKEDVIYRYAAICNDDGRWWVTGRYGPNGVGYEDFVAWLIEKDIQVDDLTSWSTAA